MAPAVAALAGIGVVMLFRVARRSWTALLVLDAAVAGTAALSLELLGRTTDAPAWAQAAVPAGAAVALLASPLLRSSRPAARRLVAIGAVAGAVALLAGPASYSAANLGRSLDGNNVLAGPAGASSMGGMGGGPGGGRMGGGPGQGTRPFGAGMGTPPSGMTFGTPPTGTMPGASAGTTGSGSATSGSATTGTVDGAAPSTATADAQGAGRGQGGPGGGGGVSDELISYLEAHQGSAKYLVAATGSQTTAGIIVETGKAVVTIGGFTGSDPSPTLAQLQEMVAGGELKYVLVGGMGGGRAGSSEITQWVQEHGTAVTDAGTTSGTLYAVSAA